MRTPFGRRDRLRNIDTAATSPPAWDASDPTGSLDRLYDYCESQTARAIRWYYENKKSKALASYLYRVLTIGLGAIGGMVPILTAWYFGADQDLDRLRYNQLGFLAVGLAAFCLALDRFTGSSTGWMRYISAAMAIETLLEDFRLDWSRLKAERPAPLTTDEAAAAIGRIKTFVLAVRAEVAKETQAWISEFQSNLAQLEQETRQAWESARIEARKEAEEREALRKQAADSQRPGGINLIVKHAQPLDAGFSVELDGKSYRQGVTARTCGIVPVAPGMHDVAVAASSGGKQLRGSKIAIVKGSEASELEIELSF